MDEAQVVVFLEIVVSQLPVGVDVIAIFVEGRRAGDRQLLEHGRHVAEEFADALEHRSEKDLAEFRAPACAHLDVDVSAPPLRQRA